MIISWLVYPYFLSLFSVMPEVTVVYPRRAEADSIARIAKVDSNFIFGMVQPPEALLYINGFPVQLEENGAFLAFLPVDWESRVYRLIASHGEDEFIHLLPFDTYRPVESTPDPGLKFPRLIELTGGAVRTDPRGTYYIFPDSGTVVVSDGWRDGYFRIPITPGHSVWACKENIRDIGLPGIDEDVVVWKVDVASNEKWVEISLPLGRRVLYRCWEVHEQNRIMLELFGVVSHIDMINYQPQTDPVKEIRWEQTANGVVRLAIDLMQSSWGYKVDWTAGKMVFKVKKPPRLRKRVKGLTIAIDPGHGGEDYGAVGPTGLTEKEINLDTANRLTDLLRRKGAEVVLTRSDDRTLGLYERIEIAENVDADMLISIHHNALPDGLNPFGDFGTGTYYYQSQSRGMAFFVQ